MKTIILLGGYGTRMRPHTWSRPKPLLNVAGNTVLGHILEQMSDVTGGAVIFVVGYKGQQIEQWVRETHPHLDSHFVVQEEALGQAHAVWLCRDYLQDDDELVLAFGDAIIEADFDAMRAQSESQDVDAVFMVDEVEDPRGHGVVVLDEDGLVVDFIEKPQTKEHNLLVTGLNWFRSSRRLLQAVDKVMREERQTLGEYFMADAYDVLLAQGARIVTAPVLQWVDTGQPQNILHANMRLLAVGHHSPDAVERSYAEDFTVLPPVYLHPEARVEASVIGPFVAIEAGAVVRESIVRNSIVDRNAVLERCILDGALVGEEAQVTGHARELFVGDNSVVEVG
ncbi:MAG TPA: sugar phosphate nucleotidyltransferase [Candidatus Sulfomarinibacteraceae bacterium]|nr:sugar phosphate nucleotidyltransferase [Candidatus Sulfomarinibacteraceae bacterium]